MATPAITMPLVLTRNVMSAPPLKARHVEANQIGAPCD